jgi:hypothetical protein
MLDHVGAPHYLFREILGWLGQLSTTGLVSIREPKLFPTNTKRESLMKRIRHRFPVPKVQKLFVLLEDGKLGPIPNIDGLDPNDEYGITQASERARQEKLHKDKEHDRKQIHKQVEATQNFATQNAPTAIDQGVFVYRYDFLEQLFDLLNDVSIFGNIDNLVVNRTSVDADGNSYFEQYQPQPGDRLDELPSGSWYRDTFVRLGLQSGIDFLLPIIIYLDKTGTDMNQRYSLEPISFSLGIIKRKVRNQFSAWRVLGYLTDLEVSSKAARKNASKASNRGRNLRNQGVVLRCSLETLLKWQDKRIPFDLRLGEYIKNVNLVPTVTFVMGDGKNADACSGRYSSHAKGVKRMCRACDVPFDKLSDPNHVCNFFTAEPIKHLVETSLLDKVIGHGTNKSELNKMMENKELPKEFWQQYPDYVPPNEVPRSQCPTLNTTTPLKEEDPTLLSKTRR